MSRVCVVTGVRTLVVTGVVVCTACAERTHSPLLPHTPIERRSGCRLGGFLAQASQGQADGHLSDTSRSVNEVSI